MPASYLSASFLTSEAAVLSMDALIVLAYIANIFTNIASIGRAVKGSNAITVVNGALKSSIFWSHLTPGLVFEHDFNSTASHH